MAECSIRQEVFCFIWAEFKDEGGHLDQLINLVLPNRQNGARINLMEEGFFIINFTSAFFKAESSRGSLNLWENGRKPCENNILPNLQQHYIEQWEGIMFA